MINQTYSYLHIDLKLVGWYCCYGRSRELWV